MPDTILKAPQDPALNKVPSVLTAAKPSVAMKPTVAHNLAHQEVLTSPEPKDYNETVDSFIRTGTIKSEVYDLIVEQQQEGLITNEVNLDYLTDPTVSLEEKQNILQFAVESVDAKEASNRQLVALHFFKGGFGDQSSGALDFAKEQIPPSTYEGLANGLNQEKLADIRENLDPFIAARGWNNMADAILDVGAQELTPFFNVASKIGLQRVFLEELKLTDKTSKWLIGERRQAIRDGLLALAPAERLQAVKNIIKEVERLQADPTVGDFITEFNILENFEAIFTEDLLEGKSSDNSFDRFFGNFESAVEGLFSVFAVARIGSRSYKGVFKAKDASKARQAARVAGAREAQQQMDSLLNNPDMARLLGIDGAAAEASTMPRPATMLDERMPTPRVVEETIARNEAYRSRILDNTTRPLGQILTDEAKTQAAANVFRQLNLGDNAKVMPGMSVVQELPDETGQAVIGVIGKTASEGYSSLDELLLDLVAFDPTMDTFKIMRRGDKGTLVDAQISKEEMSRLLSLDTASMSDADLIKRSGEVNKDSYEFAVLEQEARRRAVTGPPRPNTLLDQEFFLQYEEVRPYHPMDAIAFEGDTIRHTMMPQVLRDPNAKFGDNIVGSFMQNYMAENRTIRLFEGMYEPFYKLSAQSKRTVAQIYEWGEDFAKNEGRAPTIYDVASNFELTNKEWAGYTALRQGLDTQYEVFNNRLVSELASRGGKTIRPVADDGSPMFHGVPVARAKFKQGFQVYDPGSQSLRKLTDGDLDSIYANGGGILKLDVAVDVPGLARNKADLVIADGQTYKLGDLSKQPLEYHPGYMFRFYEDPYFIVKRTNGIAVNGVVKAGSDIDEEAIKTVGSRLEGEQFLMRLASKAEDGVEFDIVSAVDLDQGERLLRQKQALHREGRMFWDRRQPDAVPNVNSNRAELMDFVLALERGTALAARQNTQEDLMRAVTKALAAQFSDLKPFKGGAIDVKDIKQIIDDLRVLRTNSAGPMYARVTEALEIAKYLRSLQGIDGRAIPFMRAQALRAAVWADRMLNNIGFKAGKFSRIEKAAGQVDPLRAMRTTAFAAFMVFRPFRQALLQMAQPLFLTGIDPAYVLSGKGLIDSFNLRRGFIKLNKADFDEGISYKLLAKQMGLKEKEYRKLLKEFERSGVVDIVDVHSFAGGTRAFHKTAMGKAGVVGSLGRVAKQASVTTFDAAKRIGFDFGERMNRIGTYNIAWRRQMKKQGYESLLQMTDKDWQKVALDTERLTLGMNAMNKAPYQVGLASVTTQFLSFTHKVALALMGQNPALAKKEVVKIWAGMFTLFGANMFGARDYTRKALADMGLGEYADKEAGGARGIEYTLVDALSAGLIQTAVNKIGSITMEDWAELETENFTPVLNVTQFIQMNIEAVLRTPETALLGPFGNLASRYLSALEFARQAKKAGEGVSDRDKFIRVADQFFKAGLPAYDDITTARLSAKMEQWYRRSGEATPLRPTLNALIAKGLVGARTIEELRYFDLQRSLADENKEVQNMIKANRKFLKQHVFMYEKGEMTNQELIDLGEMVGMLAQGAPDGRVMEVIEGSFLPYFDDDDPRQSIVAQLGAATKQMALSKEELHFQIESYKDIPEDKKVQMHRIIEDFYNDGKLTQEDLRKELARQKGK